ncbi:MAG: PEP-CTERM sorting domain-containing protein [Anaerolineae bacterium]|nr:PEP-CTERM sorting domain-containing protein [Phycisphaerae bacterium]
MKQQSRYVFGATLASAAFAGMIQNAGAATIAAFTFETSAAGLATTNVTAPAIGPLLAESGVGSAFGSHAASNTVYSSPAGNGSPRSFSSNNWAPGDYYQFSVPTTTFTDLIVSFDQFSSSTGPKNFTLQYSTNGTSYSSFTNYSVITSFTQLATGTATGTQTISSFNSSNSFSQFNYLFNLSAIDALENNPLASFRLVNAESASSAAAGTDRVDNFVLSGTPGGVVPEPAAMGAMAVAAVAAMRRRRTM